MNDNDGFYLSPTHDIFFHNGGLVFTAGPPDAKWRSFGTEMSISHL